MTSPAPAPSPRRTLLLAGAAVVVVVLAVAGYLFQPWRAFVDRTAAESAPVAAGAAGPSVLATGDFVSIAHGTTGRVTVQQAADGSRFLRIENLDTSDGPDVRVWLTDRDVAGAGSAEDGAWVELGPLRANKGSLTYPLSADTDLTAYSSVVLWCKRFAVAFGAAPLGVAP